MRAPHTSASSGAARIGLAFGADAGCYRPAHTSNDSAGETRLSQPRRRLFGGLRLFRSVTSWRV